MELDVLEAAYVTKPYVNAEEIADISTHSGLSKKNVQVSSLVNPKTSP